MIEAANTIEQSVTALPASIDTLNTSLSKLKTAAYVAAGVGTLVLVAGGALLVRQHLAAGSKQAESGGCESF